MKLLFLLIFVCGCNCFSSAQLSLSDKKSDQQLYKPKETLHGPWKSWYENGQPLDSGTLQKNIPDGVWMTWYKNGQLQFIRTFSFDKWQQFQNEKSRYHPRSISMPITKLFHENKRQAEKYTTAINSFCGMQNCVRTNEEPQQTNYNNAALEHYHPIFQHGFLHGTFINYFPDGAIKDSGMYRNGLPEDLWIKWTDDKKFYWQGHYHHGLKNKEWKLYMANGRLIRIVFYKEDKFIWRKDMKENIGITAPEVKRRDLLFALMQSSFTFFVLKQRK